MRFKRLAFRGILNEGMDSCITRTAKKHSKSDEDGHHHRHRSIRKYPEVADSACNVKMRFFPKVFGHSSLLQGLKVSLELGV
jgi:hypothetical protein